MNREPIRAMLSEVDEVDARLRVELQECEDMDYKNVNRRIDDIDELEQIDKDEYEMARPLFGCSSICSCVRPDGLNEGDLLRISRDFIVLSRQLENATVHVETETDVIAVDFRRLDGAEPQLNMSHSQPASKTSEGSEVGDEKVQSRNSVKDRIGALIGKIKDGVQFISNVIKIWEFLQIVIPMAVIFGSS